MHTDLDEKNIARRLRAAADESARRRTTGLSFSAGGTARCSHA